MVAAENVPEKNVRRRTWIVVKRSWMGRTWRRDYGRRLEGNEGFSERKREQKTREGGTFYVGHRCGGKATVSDNNN